MRHVWRVAGWPAALVVVACGCVGNLQGGGTPSDPGNPNDPTGPEEPGPTVPAECKPQPARLWKLTPTQYTRTVQALLGDPTSQLGSDLDRTLPLKNGFSNTDLTQDMSDGHLTQLLETAQKVGAAVVASPRVYPCQQPKPTNDCIGTFLGEFGARAFRRPLPSTEISTYLGVYIRAKGFGSPPAEAAQIMVARLLMSPSFLFRSELGPDESPSPGKIVTLDPYEKASALSYFLTDGPPDADLFAAAKNGKLATTAQVADQIRRLLGKADSGVGVLRFLAELYGNEKILGAARDAKVFPEWTDDLSRDLAREGDLFFQQVLSKEDRKLSTLLGANFTMANGRLAAFYGIPGVAAGADFQRVALPASRAGILTSGAITASFSRGNETLPIRRGRFIRQSMLCQTLPPPPPMQKAVMTPPPDGMHTIRERLAGHSVADCAACHGRMDPMGLAFENYDAIGKYRDKEAGKTIDASGVLSGARPDGAHFSNGVELARLLAGSPDVSACFVQQSLLYALGRPENDGCFPGAAKAFDASGGDIVEMLVALTSDRAFYTRRVSTEPAAN